MGQYVHGLETRLDLGAGNRCNSHHRSGRKQSHNAGKGPAPSAIVDQIYSCCTDTVRVPKTEEDMLDLL